MARPEESTGRNYLRVTVEDHPGVMAEITGVLGRQGISIASLIQHEPAEGEEHVPLIVMTHAAVEGQLQQALAAIDNLPCVQQETLRMRVLD